jgi:cellulose synthase/poly-beta-1,6-N-acetylglucosamine synthase-like glycosyltransferase
VILAYALFWVSAALLAYTFVGYPLIMRVLARTKRGRRVAAIANETPPVAVVIAAYNEGTRIGGRIENILASEYPADCLRIVIVSDGSSNGTADAVRSCGRASVQLIERPVRSGKSACLNDAVATCPEPFIVFTDARQSFASDAIVRLLAPFADPNVGAVSGSLEIAPSASTAGRGLDRYWTTEKRLRQAESDFDSVIGCTGAIYAVRRELWEPLSPDAVLDDVIVPLRIAQRGFRVHFAGDAVAHNPQPLNPLSEIRRKTRTLAGNWQMLFFHPQWIVPGGHRLWWQILSHKALRLVTPLFLVLVLVSAGALAQRSSMFRAVFALQLVFYFAGLVGLGAGVRWLALPAGFLVLQWAAIRAAIRAFIPGALSRWD